MAIDIKISPENLLNWSNFEDWVDGASAAPTEHTLTGGSAAVARESTSVKKGTYSAKVTRVGADATLYHDLSSFTDYRGRKVTLGAWVYATVASRGRLSIDDGVSAASNSSYHTGGSSWEYLEVTHDINPCASQLRSGFEVNTGNTDVYFDGAILVPGDTTFLVLSTVMDVGKFKPAIKYIGQTFNVPRRAGSIMPNMQPQSKTIEVSGSVVGVDAATARTNLDTLLKMVNSNRRKPNGDREMRDLYLFEDRLIKVHMNSNNLDHKAALTFRDVRLRFTSPNPYEQYINKTRHSETISASPTTFTISTVNGNAPTSPIITVTNNGSNISSLQIENRTTGQLWAYAGSIVTGQDLVIDTELLTIKNNAVSDVANFTGDADMQLFPENNEIYVLGLVAGVVKFDWFDRWH